MATTVRGPSPVPIADATSGAGLHSAGDRLVSLDVFRGATIAAMLLVNNPGSWADIHGPLRHAEWHGWTPTDLIFPFFLFIVGVAVTLSFDTRLRRGASRGDLLLKAGRRSLILFALGLLLHAFPYWGVDQGSLRIPGVLQRIALAYLAASAIVLFTSRRAQTGITALLLLGYWGLMTRVPVPGQGTPRLLPGQDLGAWLDRQVFGTEHLWQYSRTWDPEGLLSTLPAVATVMIGVFAGYWLRSGRSGRTVSAGLFAAGVVATAVGALWGELFPINKNLWTSSYTVFTGGLALVLLAGCYWTVDVKRWRGWTTPFVVFGTNAIAAYFLSGIFARLLGMIRVEGTTLKGWLYTRVFEPALGPLNGSLAFAVAFVLLWLVLMWPLYSKRIFIKV